MDFLLFLILLFLVFGAGFVVAGLQILFALAVFGGLFVGLFILFFLIGAAFSPIFLLLLVFLLAGLIRRGLKGPPRQIEPPKQ